VRQFPEGQFSTSNSNDAGQTREVLRSTERVRISLGQARSIWENVKKKKEKKNHVNVLEAVLP